jgi:enoyl-CoA hydratase/carnithine racemase
MTKQSSAPANIGDAPILLQSVADGVGTITLNRPRQRNSLSGALMTALQQALDLFAQDPKVRCIVLAADGPAFCAGHDLKEMTSRRADADEGKRFFEETMSQCAHLMTSIVYHPKPIIARVHGIATAAGCQLVASCDLAIASNSAQFATPGVNIGLFCSTPMVALSRNVSRKHAMEMLLTGEMMDARTAADFGLVNRAVPDAELDAAIGDFAQKITSKSSKTIAIGKAAFYRQAEMQLADAYDFAAKIMIENMEFRDAKEGIDAFIERRDPTWEDR